LSAKDTKNPIGFFGTGLKYAIAILLREKHQIQIFAGHDKYNFELKNIEMRGKSFSIATINEEELPFTTDLGQTWEMWQAFREIYCNCIDEGGTVYLSESIPDPQADVTRILVKGAEFLNWFHDRHTIFLRLPHQFLVTNQSALHDNEVQIFTKPSNYIFYRGVRVAALDVPAKYTYNLLTKVQLTEDRTLMWPGQVHIKILRAISSLTDTAIIKDILTSSDEHFEGRLSYSDLEYYQNEMSQEFDNILIEQYNMNSDTLSFSARNYASKKLAKRCAKNIQSEEMTPVEEMQLARAKEICKRVYSDFDQFPIVVVRSLGQVTMAMADPIERVIILSKPCFKLGTKYLVSTMIEEYVHLVTGHSDLTRPLQTYLFDMIATLIEDHVIKEPI
jgi:hypothetical protein